MFAMIGTDRALASVVGEATKLRTFVEGADRVGAERAEAHCGNIEDRCLIGLPASIAADQDTKAGGIGHRHGPRRVRDELIAILINVDEGAESTIADFVFGERSEEHTSELQSLMRISYAVFCLKKNNKKNTL